MRGLTLFDLAFIAKKGLPLATEPADYFEDYSSGANLNGLNGGYNSLTIQWDGGWAARQLYAGVHGSDSMESYTDGVNVNGLSGGTDWTSAYVTHLY